MTIEQQVRATLGAMLCAAEASGLEATSDAWRESMSEARRLLALPPEIPTVVLTLEGGVIQHEEATVPVRLITLDFDDDGEDESENRMQIIGTGDDGGICQVHDTLLEASPDCVPQWERAYPDDEEIDTALLVERGYSVHYGGDEYAGDPLHGRWWWCCMREGWGEVEVGEGSFDTEDEAWTDAARADAEDEDEEDDGHVDDDADDARTRTDCAG